MKKYIFAALILLAVTACGDDKNRDLSYPRISTADIEASPTNCHEYRRGEVIKFNYMFYDDTELGMFNIEVHNNFDHHSHSTSSTECTMDPNKEPVKPWVFNQGYNIPSGRTEYNAKVDIPIPTDIDTGDYHFMVRLTDMAGWQQLQAFSIKIVE
jgi:hypothetical protein